MRDDAVRAVGVSAVGGTGKTALVGHWLRNTAGWRTRPFKGLFAWSFYQDRHAVSFLRELLLWAHVEFGTPPPDGVTNLVDAALTFLRAHPLVALLDGLEVIQAGPGEAHHGALLDSSLREFLTAICQRHHQSLVVLTSRFDFADLERFLGTAFHQWELRGLPPAQGAHLLDDLGVGGQPLTASASANTWTDTRLACASSPMPCPTETASSLSTFSTTPSSPRNCPKARRSTTSSAACSPSTKNSSRL